MVLMAWAKGNASATVAVPSKVKKMSLLALYKGSGIWKMSIKIHESNVAVKTGFSQIFRLDRLKRTFAIKKMQRVLSVMVTVYMSIWIGLNKIDLTT